MAYEVLIIATMGKKILSICIWTYNDCKTLFENIHSLLLLSDDRFQIIVQDNASTDETEKQAMAIIDSRFIYRRNCKNIGALPNALRSLSDINSKYGMALVARDCLNSTQLTSFIDYLEKSNIDMGRVELNKERNQCDVVEFNAGFDSFEKLSYKNYHPSGYFWKEEIINDGLKVIIDLSIPNDFDFPFELIFGNACADHGGAIYRYPLIIPQYENFKKLNKTHSYSKNNYFFSIRKRISAYRIYSTQVKRLNIDLRIKDKLLHLLNQSLFFNVSLNYHYIINDESIRFHYNITETEPSKIEYIKYLISAFKETPKDIKTFTLFLIYIIKVIRMH